MRKTAWFKLVLLLSGWVVALVTAGCDRNSGEFATIPVNGTVTIDERPLAHARIIFAPENGPSAKAESDSDGRFVLTTYVEGDGAVVGRHNVTVTARGASQEDMTGSPLMPVPGRSLIPTTYSDPTTSGLKFEVVEGQENTFKIPLVSQPTS